MRHSSERTVRPVSEHYYNKNPEDAAFHYMSRHEKNEATVGEHVGSDGEKSSDVVVPYDRKPKYYQPANDAEKAMDKKVNFKLDFIVIVICAINFVVCNAEMYDTTVDNMLISHSCKVSTKQILAMPQAPTVQ
jgi:hypothetical protein